MRTILFFFFSTLHLRSNRNLGSVLAQGLAFVNFVHDGFDLFFIASESGVLLSLTAPEERFNRESVEAHELISFESSEFPVQSTSFIVAQLAAILVYCLNIFLA